MPGPSVLFKALAAKILACSAITDIIVDRVGPEVDSSQDKYPRMTYGLVTESPFSQMEGSALLSQRDIQIICWSLTEKESSELADAVENRFDGVQAEDWEGLEMRSMTLTRRASQIDIPQSSEEETKYGTRLEFTISYQRTAPTHT